MISVRQATFDIFRPHHLTTRSGNPASTRLPMPADDHQDQIRTDGPAGASLGFGVPAAIRRRSAEPDRPMVAVSGDGAFRYAAPALWSAARYEEGLTAVVLRNHRIELPVGGCAGSHR